MILSPVGRYSISTPHRRISKPPLKPLLNEPPLQSRLMSNRTDVATTAPMTAANKPDQTAQRSHAMGGHKKRPKGTVIDSIVRLIMNRLLAAVISNRAKSMKADDLDNTKQFCDPSIKFGEPPIRLIREGNLISPSRLDA